MATFDLIKAEGTPFLELRLDLQRPVEVQSLTRLLNSIVSQFRSHIAAHHPDLANDAVILIRDVRKGSLIFELVPWIMSLYQAIDIGLTIDSFINRMRAVIETYASGNSVPDAKRSDVSDFMNTVKLIAQDDSGSLSLESADYHETKSTKRVSFKFDTHTAKPALERLEKDRATIEGRAHEVFENVLLTFWQSNKAETDPGRKTHEKAIIEAVTTKPLAVIYETEAARDRIKHETSFGDRNIYRLGFYVDCYVERLGGKPVAYKLTSVRDIIPLPDD